jgi:transcriptional regulator with GAF, ATPase, and Fis domain
MMVNMKSVMTENSSSQNLDEITEISTAIVEREYIDGILKLIAPVALKVTESQICTLFLLDKTSNELVLRASHPDSYRYDEKSSVPLGKGIAGRVAQVNKVISVPDFRNDRRFLNKKNAIDSGLASLLSMPMSVDGEVVGVVNCYSLKEGSCSSKEIRMLSEVICQAAVVLKSTRLRLMKEIARQELDEARAIRQAEEIIMKKKRISGAEVLEMFRKQSLKTHWSMAKIAASIILASAFDRAAI